VIGIRCKTRLYTYNIAGCNNIGYNNMLGLQYILCNYKDYSILFGLKKFNIDRADYIVMSAQQVLFYKQLANKFGIVPIIVLCKSFEQPRGKLLLELPTRDLYFDLSVFHSWPFLNTELIRIILNKDFIKQFTSK